MPRKLDEIRADDKRVSFRGDEMPARYNDKAGERDGIAEGSE